MSDIAQGIIADTQDMEQEQNRRLDEKLRSALILPSSQFEAPDYTLSKDGIGFAPLGNICAIMSEKKNGKTFLNTIFAAALLRGEFLGLKCEIENPRILFFDTEQDRADGQTIQRRIQYLCGWDFTDDITHRRQFNIFHMRELSMEDRRDVISYAVRTLQPNVVFIDGVRDLLNDFNDIEESNQVVQLLLTLSSEQHCLIWTVLHSNQNSEKMRGHLGTELGNKVTDTFRVRKNKDKNTGFISFDVDHMDARHRDTADWSFKIDDTLPYGIPVPLTSEDADTVLKGKEDYRQELLSQLRLCIHDTQAVTRTKLQSLLKNTGMGSKKAWGIIVDAINEGVLVEVIGGKYRIQATSTTEKQQDLPF